MEKAEQAAFVATLKGQLDAFRAGSDARLQKLSSAVATARARIESQLQLASRVILLAERCREFESAGERTVPVPMPDVAVGPVQGTVVAGPAASTRTAIGLLLSHPASGEAGQQQQPESPSASSPTLVAATVALTSGALVPVGLTAARHGLVPRADGLLGEAAVAAGAAMARQGGAEAWDVVQPGVVTAGGTRAAVPSAAAAFNSEHQQQQLRRESEGGAAAAVSWRDPSDAEGEALEASAAEQTASARKQAESQLPPDGTRLLAETADSAEIDALELFWRRYNRALLDSLVLERQKVALAEENAGLQVRR